ncbi:MAG: DUF6477 family protein [Rhodobacteraceae bacterium]|nr:DUF6477 family protein [Paracoccaceae bacterium]
MPDLLQLVSDLKRPQLLIRAARAGLADYNRNRDLKRLMRSQTLPHADQAIARLLAEEEQMEATRKRGDAGYSFARHIELLIAVIAEARLILRPAQPQG